MKVFWLSVFFFLLVLLCTVLNARYVHGVFDELCAILDGIDVSSDPLPSATDAEALWKANRSRIGWSAGRRRILAIDEALTELLSASANSDTPEIQKSLALLMNAIEELVRQERFSLTSIF